MWRIKKKAELSKEEKRRREIFESILCIMMVIFIITQIMLPETGVLGMVNEGSLSILFLGYGGSFLWSGIKRRKEDKTAVILGVLCQFCYLLSEDGCQVRLRQILYRARKRFI